MENFLEFIKGDIESKNILISTLPTNNKTNIRKYNEALDSISKTYNDYKASVKKYMDVKSNSFNIPKRKNNIEELTKELESLREVRFILNPLNTYFEKMRFDRLIYKISNYSEFNFDSLNEILNEFLDKIESAGIRLEKSEFNYTCYVYEYMSIFIDERISKTNNHDILSKKFEELYWSNPELINHIELNFRKIIKRHEKEFKNYLNNKQKELKEKNNVKDYDDAVVKFNETYIALKNEEEEDITDIINLAKSGTIDMNSYAVDSKVRRMAYETLAIVPIKIENKEEMSKFYETLKKLKYNIIEYSSYIEFLPLFKSFKAEYDKQIGTDTKELNKKIKDIESAIDKSEGNLERHNKKLITKNGLSPTAKDNSSKPIRVDSVNMANELYKSYQEYETEAFKIKVLSNLNKFSTASELLNIYYSFSYFKKKALKKVFEITNNKDLDKYNENIDILTENPNNVIVNVVDIFNDEDIAKVIVNKYRLDNINITIESLGDSERNVLLNKIEMILRIEKITNSNIDEDKLWFMAEVEKINKAMNK